MAESWISSCSYKVNGNFTLVSLHWLIATAVIFLIVKRLKTYLHLCTILQEFMLNQTANGHWHWSLYIRDTDSRNREHGCYIFHCLLAAYYSAVRLTIINFPAKYNDNQKSKIQAHTGSLHIQTHTSSRSAVMLMLCPATTLLWHNSNSSCKDIMKGRFLALAEVSDLSCLQSCDRLKIQKP